MSFASVMASKSPSAWFRLGESSGSTMVDASGNGRNGTYGGGPWSVPTLGSTGLLHDGDTDTAATFNGSTSEGEIAYDASWMNLSTFSVFVRMKPNTTSGNHTVVGRFVGGAGNAWMIRQDGTTLNFVWQDSSGYHTQALGTVASGTEYSVGLTHGIGGGVATRLFLDGTFVAAVTHTLTITPSTASFIVGANYQGSPTEVFSGVLDEVAYLNGAWTDTDQADLHAATQATPDATVTPPAATFTASAAAPVGSSTAVTPPPAATFTMSAKAPVVATNNDAVVSAPAASFTASAPAPGVSYDAAVTSTAATFSMSAPTPTVGVTTSATVTSPAATFTVSAPAPRIDNGSGNQTVTPPAAVLLMSAPVPSLSVTYVTPSDTSNASQGRRRRAYAVLTVTAPVVAPSQPLATVMDVAIPYPQPTMVNGRPT